MRSIVAVAVACTVACAIALAACGGDDDPPPASTGPAVEPGPNGCASLAGLSLERTEVLGVEWNAATSGVFAEPAHCKVQGVIDRRTGVDGVEYGIRFEVRLPDSWNGRFYFQGGFGTDGALSPALGPFALGGNALTEGYAVATTDAGHTSAGPEFGRDPKARIDYGYVALDQTTLRAKDLIGRYYGRAPEYSYLSGCSNGGRQGMVAAQRFPQYFDGILAGNPGFRLPQTALSEAWNTQAVAEIATGVDASGKPDLGSTFSDDDLRLLERGILDACDDRDGLADGIVYDFFACTFDPGALECAGAKTPDCLTAGQVSALRKIFGGPRSSRGEALYSDFPWDAGLTSPLAFRSWILGTPGTGGALNASLGAGALTYIFVTPPPATDDPLAYVLGFDFDVDAPKIFATSGEFSESSVSFMTADSTSRDAFREHGGKLLIYHGASDAVFSVNDTIRWWEALDAEEGGSAASFVRLFSVPGMGHCGSGGISTDRFDAFPALVDWVERGIAPDRIEATATAASPWPGRTRPLCPHPQQPRYRGSGSIESADSFDCR
ncbi:MAG: tannase/feruloyl esterase family alpha/beta hydrolase [Deltaproteobacteria bacterium]|nr:tannase/feruloyl esterase family alpha/beta hydrolase [Deltaproteobacteria bacterium]